MSFAVQKASAIKKIKAQCLNTQRPEFVLRRVFGQYVLFSWTPWSKVLPRLIFAGDWRPVAILSFDSAGKPSMSFCNKIRPCYNDLSKFESQNDLFPELKVDNLEIKYMSADQEILFHRLFFYLK